MRFTRLRRSIRLDFEQLAQAMPHIVYVANARGSINFINQQWTSVTGHPVVLALKHGLADLVHPDDRQKILTFQNKRYLAGIIFSEEYRLFCKPGVYRWQLARAVPNHDGQGNIVSWYGTLTDIDAFKQAQTGWQFQTDVSSSLRATAKKEDQTQLHHLLISSEAAVSIVGQKTLSSMMQEVANQALSVIDAQTSQLSLTIDFDGVRHLNAVASNLLENSGKSLSSQSHKSHQDLEMSVAQYGRPIRLARIDTCVDAPAGDKSHDFQLGWLGVPVVDKNGVNIGLLQLAGKIDGEFNTKDEYFAIELAQLAAGALNNFKLLAQMRELNLSNVALKSFSHSVSHDLRSPLSNIDGFSRLLAKEISGEQNNKVQHCLARIHSGVTQMNGLIEGMLALATLTPTHLQTQTTDLSQISNAILEGLQRQNPQRQVIAKVKENLIVQGDSRLLTSVMQNLIENAWKYSEKQPCSIIEIGFSDAQQAYFVKDNGVGFDMLQAGELFADFERLPSAKNYAGFGVGLASAARVISRHGGRIWAESKSNCGATFFFTLNSAV
jgi:PAS domain S-box-containing protein